MSDPIFIPRTYREIYDAFVDMDMGDTPSIYQGLGFDVRGDDGIELTAHALILALHEKQKAQAEEIKELRRVVMALDKR